MKKRPVGVFDSGVGGLGIAAAIRQLLPDQDILYLADTAHFPYGEKTGDEIRQIAKEAAQRLFDGGAKLVVIACNTATTAAISEVRKSFPGRPIVGVVPMIKPASGLTKTGIVAVMVTPATLIEEYYQELKEDFAKGVRVIDQACPDWVEMAESGIWDEAAISRPIERVLSEGADVIVLGCTHFPLLMPAVKAAVKGRARVIEPAEAVAIQVGRLLREENQSGRKGEIEIIISGPTGQVRQVAERLFVNNVNVH